MCISLGIRKLRTSMSPENYIDFITYIQKYKLSHCLIYETSCHVTQPTSKLHVTYFCGIVWWLLGVKVTKC